MVVVVNILRLSSFTTHSESKIQVSLNSQKATPFPCKSKQGSQVNTRVVPQVMDVLLPSIPRNLNQNVEIDILWTYKKFLYKYEHFGGALVIN